MCAHIVQWALKGPILDITHHVWGELLSVWKQFGLTSMRDVKVTTEQCVLREATAIIDSLCGDWRWGIFVWYRRLFFFFFFIKSSKYMYNTSAQGVNVHLLQWFLITWIFLQNLSLDAHLMQLRPFKSSAIVTIPSVPRPCVCWGSTCLVFLINTSSSSRLSSCLFFRARWTTKQAFSHNLL